MRHQVHNKKFGRSGAHREALVAALVVALIKRHTVRTTLVKAKVARQAAEKLVTLARKNTLAARRLVASRLRDEEAARLLVNEIAPKYVGRPGGYTRVLHNGCRRSDGSEMAILQWVDAAPAAEAPAAPAEEEPAKA